MNKGEQTHQGPSDDTNSEFAAPAIIDLRHTDIPAIAERLLPLRRELAAWIDMVGLAPDQTDAVILAVDEAMSNVVSHAYQNGAGTFDLLASCDPEQGTVHVVVRDRGAWQPEEADPGPLHGRGLILIRALAHQVRFDQAGTGTTVHMTWLLPNHRPGPS